MKAREISRASFTLDGVFRLMYATREQGIVEFHCEDYRGKKISHLVAPRMSWAGFLKRQIKEVIDNEQ